jgi:hypothetical protein
MISGTTALIAHMGYPTHTFKSSLICNPWFEKNGVPLPLPGGQVDDLTDMLLAEARWRRHGIGDIRRPDEPLTLHPSVGPPL